MLQFKNHWFRAFLLLLSILAPNYSRVSSDLLQVPSWGYLTISAYTSGFRHDLFTHLSPPPELVQSPWPRVGTNAYLFNWCLPNRLKGRWWCSVASPLPHLLSFACPLEAPGDVSQVVLWWEFDKGPCGGRENVEHLKPHSEAPPPLRELVPKPFTKRCTRAAGLAN